MERDAIALAVEHDGAEAVLADALYRGKHPAAVLLRLLHRVADAAVDVHVDEDALVAHLAGVGDQAAAVAVGAFVKKLLGKKDQQPAQ